MKADIAILRLSDDWTMVTDKSLKESVIVITKMRDIVDKMSFSALSNHIG